MSMAELSAFDVGLLTSTSVGHFVTLHPDGSPHATPLWVDAADGHVLVNTAAGRVKDRNVRRDPRVAVSVTDEADPESWLSIGGTVVEVIDGPEAEEHIDALSRRYSGEPWSPVPGQRRVMFRIRPDRIARSSG